MKFTRSVSDTLRLFAIMLGVFAVVDRFATVQAILAYLTAVCMVFAANYFEYGGDDDEELHGGGDEV